MKKRFARLLLKWYERNARRLPWRGVDDPYAVWVSEVMLQQTRVETVIPYYQRWMARFPDLRSLAAASEQDVLREWEGLGYYSRARQMVKVARQLVKDNHARLPRDPRELEKLPGVGRYTAGAIASIAFGADTPALDGNIKRVLARVFDIDQPVDETRIIKQLWMLAEELLPRGRAGEYNQAMMDLGATICLARNPLCGKCPLEVICQARRNGTQSQRPVRKVRKAIPHYVVAAAVIWRGGKVLIARRPSKGLLGGLWEYPGGKQQAGENLPETLQRELAEELAAQVEVGSSVGIYRHAYTHFRLTLHAFSCKLTGPEPQPLEASQLAWVTPADLGSYPMGNIDRRISDDLIQLEMKVARR
jgi:A/G-specific adenine glycosylase